MRVLPMKKVTITIKGIDTTWKFQTEKEALAVYHKYKNHHLVEKIVIER